MVYSLKKCLTFDEVAHSLKKWLTFKKVLHALEKVAHLLRMCLHFLRNGSLVEEMGALDKAPEEVRDVDDAGDQAGHPHRAGNLSINFTIQGFLFDGVQMKGGGVVVCGFRDK